ncbi:MAG: 50S ribosomal protein L25/general stress protein Ctc [Zetaproteobacteria bacterium]|nr:50S ribosomal protein L25/general stress protein Ctc [Zetaproteobacteria bacterium]
MADYTINATLREKTGKGENRRMRRAGMIPAIIYGGEKADLPIILNQNAINKLLDQEHFFTTMIDINIEGKSGSETVILKDSQWCPMYDTATHLDFLRVNASDSVHLEVPVVAINSEKAPGIVAGGMIDLIRHTLEVTCRADSIPEHIEIDCSTLNIGDTVHIDDITLPDGVEVHHEVNFTILNLAALKVAKSEESEEASA